MSRLVLVAVVCAAAFHLLVTGSKEGLRGSAPKEETSGNADSANVTKSNAQFLHGASPAEPPSPSLVPIRAEVVRRAAESLGQPCSRAEAEGLAAKMNKDQQGLVAKSEVVNDWNTIASNLRSGTSNGFYNNIPTGMKGPDGQPLTTSLAPYAKMVQATFAIVGAIDGLSSSKADWGMVIYNVGTALAPLISMYNPVLGAIAVTFMAFFSPGSGQGRAFQQLYTKIMKDVTKMINEKFVEEHMGSARNIMASIAKTWEDSPQMVANSSFDDTPDDKRELRTRQLSFFQGQVKEFNIALPVIFGSDCVDNLKPKTPPSPECITFTRKGALTFQYVFAMQHLNIYIQYGSIAPPEERPIHLKNLKKTAQIYHRLLSASYRVWLNHGGDYIPQCSYNRATSHCPHWYSNSNCDVDYVLTPGSTTDENTGQEIPNVEGCKTTVKGRGGRYEDLPCCSNPRKCREDGYDGCDDHHFNNYRNNWKKFVGDWKPLVENITQIMCGKKGVKGSSKPVMNACSSSYAAECTCRGEPCEDDTECRSRYGYCGKGPLYCRAWSTWTSDCWNNLCNE